jgi:hypothetical protein
MKAEYIMADLVILGQKLRDLVNVLNGQKERLYMAGIILVY